MGIDLSKILKDCPYGMTLYSVIHGDVIYKGIDETAKIITCYSTHEDYTCCFTYAGTFHRGCGECILFPSKENRNWDTFTPPIAFLPNTWDKYISSKLYDSINIDIDINEEYIDSLIAFGKLVRLRDCYNNGWTPDWTDINTPKFCIYFNRDKVTVEEFYVYQVMLHFKTEELRDLFLENFEELILTAKPLL